MNIREQIVSARRLREVPAAHIKVGTVVWHCAPFTALMISKPDAEGVSHVGSLVGPSVVGMAREVTALTDGEIHWQGQAEGGVVTGSWSVPSREGRITILLPEGS